MRISKSKKAKRIAPHKIKNVIKSHEVELLQNIEQRISLNVDSFLALSEEGDPTQIALALQKAQSEFVKFGPEMHRIALKVGGELPAMVDDFLENIDTVLHQQGMLDENLIHRCLNSKSRLKAELHAHY